MDVKSLIVGEMQQAQTRIRSSIASKGINASGRTSNSLRVEERPGSIVLVMGGDRSKFGKTAPLETLEVGSRPGIRGKWFKSVIYYWSIEKRLSFENDSHRWAFSTIVARNIEAEGTARHKNHVDVYSTIVADEKHKIKVIIAQNLRSMVYNMIK